jgi:protein phosphatase
LTHDHSYVSRLVENGTITAEEAEVHPQRHVLTAALGVGMEVSPDASEHPLDLKTGDTLVLCSDGLWGLVTEAEIQNEVTKSKPAEACSTLIAMAKKRGGPDNITLQVIRIL